MDKLTGNSKVAVPRLAAPDLERYPVWSWDEDRDCYEAVVEYDPLPTDLGGFAIGVVFQTDSGHTLGGYVVGSGSSFYAFTIFLDEERFKFNLNLNPYEYSRLSLLRSRLEPDPIFPITYEAPWSFSDGNRIAGVFDLYDFRQI